jgi:LysM repeat protein
MTQLRSLPTASKTTLVLTRRGRQARTALIAALVFIPLIVSIASTSSDHVAPGPRSYVTVQSGDSLWSIARQVAPGQDPRDWIVDAMTLNGLSGPDIYAGQSIAIP